jgi:translation initiation factor IF-1
VLRAARFECKCENGAEREEMLRGRKSEDKNEY